MSEKVEVCSFPWKGIRAMGQKNQGSVRVGFRCPVLKYLPWITGEWKILNNVWKKLVEYCKAGDRPLILVGSSMGGYVATVCSGIVPVAGLFLMAPALYLDGYQVTDYQPLTSRITVIHGWGDELIPPENSFRFARQTGASLHVLDADHPLAGVIPEIIKYFSMFLGAGEPYLQ